MKDYLKQLIRAMADDNIDSMASSIAYAQMLSLFPFLIGVFAMLQLLQHSGNIVVWTLNTFDDFFPLIIRNFVMNNFNNISYERTGSILVFSLAASIGFGSYGFKTIFIHLSRILRDEKPRSFIWMSVLSIFFATGAMVVIAVSFILILLSGNMIHSISNRLELGRFIPTALNLLRYPFVFLFLIVSTSIVYKVGPRRKVPWNCIFLSSLVFTCGWIIATFLFGIYIAKFARYNLIYGALASVIIFLVWTYLSAFIFLSAAEIGRIRMEHLKKASLHHSKSAKGDTESDKPDEKTEKYKGTVSDTFT